MRDDAEVAVEAGDEHGGMPGFLQQRSIVQRLAAVLHFLGQPVGQGKGLGLVDGCSRRPVLRQTQLRGKGRPRSRGCAGVGPMVLSHG